MLSILRGSTRFTLIFSLLALGSLAGCAIATQAPAQPPVPTTNSPTVMAATATSVQTDVPASVTPAPSATSAPSPTAPQPSPRPSTGPAVVVSSPVAPGQSGPLTGITPPAVGGIVPVPTNGQLVVTMANNGATVKLRPGDRFVLMLGDVYNWEVAPDDPKVVSRVVNITPVRGSQGVYEARQVGQTTLNASGDPTCRQSQPPCMMPSLLFQLKVVVQ